MGPYQEGITTYTIIGLVVTLAGFGLYQWATEVYRKKLEAKKKAEEEDVDVVDDEDAGAKVCVKLFKLRIVSGRNLL